MAAEFIAELPYQEDETPVFFSKGKILFSLVIFCLLSGFGAFLFFIGGDEIVIKIVGIIECLLFLLLAVMNTRQLVRKEPALIISTKGIALSKTWNSGYSFSHWGEISHEHISTEYARKGGKMYFLKFYTVEGERKFLLDDLRISRAEMKQLLIDYRERYRHGTRRQTKTLWEG